MPPYRFTGFVAFNYPALRDARGLRVGDVAPGDVRDLDEPPDRQWAPVVSDPPWAIAPEPVPAEPEPAGDGQDGSEDDHPGETGTDTDTPEG